MKKMLFFLSVGLLFSSISSFGMEKSDEMTKVKNFQNDSGNTPLHSAVLNNNYNISKMLINYGVVLDAKNKEGLAPIHIAVTQNNRAILELLIKSGANINLKDKRGLDAINLAAIMKNAQSVRALALAGANLESIRDRSENLYLEGKKVLLLFKAIKNKDLNRVITLINAGADLNIQDADGNTPLHYAIINQTEDIAKILFYKSYKDVLDIKNKDNKTPLLLAVGSGMYRLLLFDKNIISKF